MRRSAQQITDALNSLDSGKIEYLPSKARLAEVAVGAHLAGFKVTECFEVSKNRTLVHFYRFGWGTVRFVVNTKR